MGSWNETCALSNLPVSWGAEVVWLLITASPYKGIRSGCHLSDYYFVRSPPLYGVYDDYGRVALHEGQELLLDTIQKQFEKDLVPRAQTDRGKVCGIPPVGMEGYSFAQLQDWLHEGEIYVNPKLIKKREDGYYSVAPDESQDPSPVQRIMIRRDVWDAFATKTLRTWQGTSELENYKTHADQYLETIAEYFEECANAPKDEPTEVRIDRFRKGMDLESGGQHWFEKRNFFMGRFGSGAGDGIPPFGQHGRSIRASLSEALREGEMQKEQVREIFHRLCDLAQVEDVMSMARMNWGPTTGAGSQGEELELSMELHLAMAACAYKTAMAGYEESLWDEGTDPSPKLKETWERYP